LEDCCRGKENDSFTCPITYESDREWERERKAARFFVKARMGIMVGIAKGKRFRWWTLTESNESIEAGMNFSHSWSTMRKYIARLDEQLEWCLVEHIQGDKMRRNWHVLTYGDNKLPVEDMREYWQTHFMSTVTGLAEVKNPFKSAAYLAGYLGRDDKFQKARFSQNWVFPYWWEFGKFYKKEKGIYVPDDELVRMSLINLKKRRETNFWFNIFVDVRKYGWEEIFERNNDKWIDILKRRRATNNVRNKENGASVGYMQGELWVNEIDESG
jgi:hypothetical protein